jgi:hypothetical protein
MFAPRMDSALCALRPGWDRTLDLRSPLSSCRLHAAARDGMRSTLSTGMTLKTIMLLGAMIAGLLVQDAYGSEIWFSPVDPVSQPSNPGAAHYMDLFRPDANWDRAAAKIQVFKVSTHFLHVAPEEYLTSVIQDLKRRNIRLAMEGFMLTASFRCGNGGVESYASPGTIRDIIARLAKLGGTLSYVAMDEPVHFGHYYNGHAACRDPIKELAEQMVSNVKALKLAFPDIEFGEIEPLNNATVNRIDTMLEFGRDFRIATGEPIRFIAADIIWKDDWRPQLLEWQKKANTAGIGLGVIIDGDNNDKDDQTWAGKAIRRYTAVMRDLPRPPEQIIFQSWMTHPSRAQPDNQPGTLSSIVLNSLTQSESP